MCRKEIVMIQRIGVSSLSFKANDVTSARDGYKAKVDSNVLIAQNQNDIVSKVVPNVANSQIAMQGNNTNQKLNIIA